MGQITILDRNMVNMIAAGEVIERPASVVKEFLENSIDAGATKITVQIADGGKKLISITDNGCGMDAEDLAYAFEPHATSKLKSTSDLSKISTLGFRGEALASISSIAHVKTYSRVAGSDNANCIEIDCGDKSEIAPCSADFGTTIEVRDLFYKLPARRKFLKTDNTEASHITEAFTRIALANPKLDMTLIRNNREVFRLTANQSLTDRIEQLFSTEIANNLVETTSEEKDVRIFALLGKPRISRTNSRFQYVFLNGRFIRDKFIFHAIREAYRGLLEPNRFPVIFLFIEMPYENYDVNVHPTKIEVRFYNSNLLHSQILGTLREKLLGTKLDVDAVLPHASIHAPASGNTGKITDAMADFFKKHRPATTEQRFDFTTNKSYSHHPEQFAAQNISSIALQIHNSFIVTQAEDGFVIIDQHALHERILYEKLRNRINTGNLESQKLLIPESFELTNTQAETIKNNVELLKKLGIELIPFGPRTMAVQSFQPISLRTYWTCWRITILPAMLINYSMRF
jgi:DNA mismatch repair protein MutL